MYVDAKRFGATSTNQTLSPSSIDYRAAAGVASFDVGNKVPGDSIVERRTSESWKT